MSAMLHIMLAGAVTGNGWSNAVPDHTTLQNAFLILGFVVLGLICASTFYQAFSLQATYMGKDDAEGDAELLDGTATSISLAGWVTGVGFCHYLILFQGYGRVMLSNGEEFAWITYLEFLITTPVILYNTASLIHATQSVLVQLIIFDILMICTGFVASVSTSVAWRYVWYCISWVFFIGILKILLQQGSEMAKVLGEEFKDIAVLYRRLMILTVITWSIYPILFIFGPNGSVLEHGEVTEVVAVCDIFSKGLSGVLFSFANRSLHKAQDKLFGEEEEEETSCFGLCVEKKAKKPQQQMGMGGMDPQMMQQMMQMMMMQQQQQQGMMQNGGMMGMQNNPMMQMGMMNNGMQQQPQQQQMMNMPQTPSNNGMDQQYAQMQSPQPQQMQQMQQQPQDMNVANNGMNGMNNMGTMAQMPQTPMMGNGMGMMNNNNMGGMMNGMMMGGNGAQTPRMGAMTPNGMNPMMMQMMMNNGNGMMGGNKM